MLRSASFHRNHRLRAKYLAAAVKGLLPVAPHPLNLSFIADERQYIRAALGRNALKSQEILPLRKRKEALFNYSISALKNMPTLNSWSLELSLNITNDTPCARFADAIYRLRLQLDLPFKTLVLHRKFSFFLTLYPYLPYELEEISEVELVLGEPPATLYKTKAFLLPPKSQRQRGVNLNTDTLYIIRHKNFTNCGVSLSGVISGAKTRVTNKLLRALGEK